MRYKMVVLVLGYALNGQTLRLCIFQAIRVCCSKSTSFDVLFYSQGVIHILKHKICPQYAIVFFIQFPPCLITALVQ